MVSKRLARLSLLTQGLALVGLSAAPTGCDKGGGDPPREGNLHINAPPQPSATQAPSATPSATPVTAMPVDAGATPDPGASAAPMPVHINSPPPQVPTSVKPVSSQPKPEYPKHINSRKPGP